MRALSIAALLALFIPSLTNAQADADPYEVDAAALRRAASSLVEVHCLGSVLDDAGLGFAYGDRTHVLTTATRGACRNALYVIADGERVNVRASQISEDLDIARLELDAALPSSVVPLVADAFVDPVRGAPLAYFTYALPDTVEGESPFGLMRTSVENTDPLRFELQLGGAGSPVLDREGHLLGMARPTWEGMAFVPLVHVDDIETWLMEAEAPGSTRRRITLGLDEGYLVGVGRGDLLSVGLGIGVTTAFDDTFTLRGDMRLDLLLHMGDPRQDAPAGFGVSTGMFVGLRTAAYSEDGPRLAVSFEVGAVGGYALVPPSPGETSYADVFYVRPAARVGVSVGPVGIGYEFQLDPERPEQSVHQFSLSAVFE
jgi:hypothetical protein